MDKVEKSKILTIAILSTFMDALGILAVPVLLLVGCNVIDYATGLAASGYRNEKISSYKSIHGIYKKVCMWLLVVVGAMIDKLIQYSATYVSPNLKVPFVVATVVAVWLVINEIISILENMKDTGVKLPPFLLPLVNRLRDTTETVAGSDSDEEGEDNV